MRSVSIFFDESIPIIEIIRSVTAAGWTLRGTGDGSLIVVPIVVPIEEIDYSDTPLPAQADQTVVPFQKVARCES